jgi:hypothetical protein
LGPLHVDKLLLGGKNIEYMKSLIQQINGKLDITVESEPTSILGYNIIRDRLNKKLTITSEDYIVSLIEKFNIAIQKLMIILSFQTIL